MMQEGNLQGSMGSDAEGQGVTNHDKKRGWAIGYGHGSRGRQAAKIHPAARVPEIR